jgi:hypothetical protein
MGLLLDGEAALLEEIEILDQPGGLVEVREDTDATPLGRLEDGAEQTHQVEGWKLPVFGVEKDLLGQIGREASG